MSTQKYVNRFFGLNNKYHCPGLYTQVLKYLMLGKTYFYLGTMATGHQLSLLLRFVRIEIK